MRPGRFTRASESREARRAALERFVPYSLLMVSMPPSRVPGYSESSEGSGDRVRVGLSLTQGDYDRLKKVADQTHLPVGEVIQRAIATALFLQEQINKGSKILIEERNGKVSEFVVL